MNKAALAETIAKKVDSNKNQAVEFLDAFEDIITETIKGGDDVTLTGFGTFSARVRKARMGVNPQNPTERIQIPTVTVPKFKAGKALKDALKAKVETVSEQE
ncbi:HU family DNA-binding protein [bacterium]|jgi:DNA-binding protein HU-beta|nr:HU family DNA-binding protein [bacterium]MBT4121944.1 HU family DNA-binding protein [bacterium]MBT4334911.1 HU family DNA-binding protein [bacterium]MBT4495828.1 HU family DNA-binding protein [bacterium]MBT4763705.1 HU family DNA-binding protein [bacterium]